MSFGCFHRLPRAVWQSYKFTSLVYKTPTQPHSVSSMFGSWLCGLSKELKLLALLGAAAMYWSLWLCRNDLVFEMKHTYFPLQVIYLIIYWLRTRAVLQKPTSQDLVVAVSRGRNRIKHCCSRCCQSTCLWWLGWTQEHKNHRGDAMVYPGSGLSMPYVRQLLILILKSTQNRRVITQCTGERELW